VPGIEPGISGSVARNSDHQTTEAVYEMIFDMEVQKIWSYSR
jgi:hypothetical protein